MISELYFRTSYEFKVNGFNEVGHGPPGNLIVVQTLQKGKYMQPGSALLDFLFCTNFFQYCYREQKCHVTKIQSFEIMRLDGIFRKNKKRKSPCQKSAC